MYTLTRGRLVALIQVIVIVKQDEQASASHVLRQAVVPCLRTEI